MIKTLLLTGRNNHNWERSAPFCQKLLEDTGEFDVTLTTDPADFLANNPEVEDFDLFFVDYNKGPDMGEPAKQKFVSSIQNGTGVCILHASNNAFRGWVEYEEICALMWREGTSHGSYHRFDVTLVDQEHPITAGLPTVLKNHPDELYHKMVHMHDADFHVLATAYSSPESGGTGNDEPVVLVKEYGKGRVFHNILGHVGHGGPMDTFESPDFQRILLRGCQWAGGGQVTL